MEIIKKCRNDVKLRRGRVRKCLSMGGKEEKEEDEVEEEQKEVNQQEEEQEGYEL